MIDLWYDIVVSKPKALITGVSGQTGAYLAKRLLDAGYDVVGTARRSASGELWRLRELGIENQVCVEVMELTEQGNIDRVIKRNKPEKLFHLAAQSFVGDSFKCPIWTGDANAMGTARILEALRNHSSETRYCHASTSELFGKVQMVPQNELTQFYPRSPYGISKQYAHWMGVNYRESYDMFCSNLIAFNHCSPLRGNQFVTKKITNNIAKWKLGKIKGFELGNMDAKRDWSHADDVAGAYMKILDHDEPTDLVVGSGVEYSVREFIQFAFDAIGQEISFIGKGKDEAVVINGVREPVITVNPKYYRPCEVDTLLADPRKIKKVLGWKPKYDLKALISEMIEYDLRKESK